MNSQFRNSSFGFILYTTIIGLILLATIFVIWYMTMGYKLGTYAPDTRIGNVYIGGLTEGEAIPKLDEKINYWYSDETIVFELKYQGYSYQFNRSLLFFDTNSSLYDVNPGTVNEILVYYQGVDRSSVENEIRELDFLENIIDNVDVSLLINDVLKDASLMKTFSIKNIEDYLLVSEDSISEIGTAQLIMPEGFDLDLLIDSIYDVFDDGKIYVDNKSIFDITEVFSLTMNDNEMTIVSSAMLAILLETNFIINEVHYNANIDVIKYTIDNYPYFARNANVNQVINESFSFYNPNESTYYFTIEKLDDSNGVLTMYGYPLEYDIDVTINKTELNYITQYTGNTILRQDGFNGVIIEVLRVVTDINGNIVYNRIILFEFYPPIKEIIYEP